MRCHASNDSIKDGEIFQDNFLANKRVVTTCFMAARRSYKTSPLRFF